MNIFNIFRPQHEKNYLDKTQGHCHKRCDEFKYMKI